MVYAYRRRESTPFVGGFYVPRVGFADPAPCWRSRYRPREVKEEGRNECIIYAHAHHEVMKKNFILFRRGTLNWQKVLDLWLDHEQVLNCQLHLPFRVKKTPQEKAFLLSEPAVFACSIFTDGSQKCNNLVERSHHPRVLYSSPVSHYGLLSLRLFVYAFATCTTDSTPSSCNIQIPCFEFFW